MEYANKRRNDELIIDLKELFWRLLEQWKAIVVFALIIALLFSGLMYLRISSRVEEEAVVKTPDEILSELSPDDQEAVLGAFTLREARDKVQKYISESPLMSLDPYNVNTVTTKWMISSDEGINKQLIAAYVNELSSYEAADSVNKAWGEQYETDAVRELLIAKSDIPLETEANLESNLLSLCIYLPEGTEDGPAIEAIEKVLPGMTQKLTDSIGAHSISLVSSDTQVISDTLLSDAQYNVYNRLYNLNYNLNYLMKNVMTSDQKSAYEAMNSYDDAEDEEAEAGEPEEPGKVKFFNKKRFLLGFILGCILYCGLYLLYFVFSGRSLTPKVLEESFGIRTLGEWYSDRKGGPLSILMNDNFIYRKRHKGHTSLDVATERIAGSIKNAFEGKEGGKLVVVSNGRASESTRTLIASVGDRLKESDIYIETCDIDPANGIYLGENVLAEGECAALVIDHKSSNLKDVRDVCEKCIVCEVPFIGAAYVE